MSELNDKIVLTKKREEYADRKKEISPFLSESDERWLLNRLIKENPELSDYEKDPEKEYLLLSRACFFLFAIKEDKPSNIRAYVETSIMKKEYADKLGIIAKKIWDTPLGQEKDYDQLQGELEKILNEAEKEFPGFAKNNERQISEIMGDLLALRTGGKMGSMRMVQRISLWKKAKKKKARSI